VLTDARLSADQIDAHLRQGRDVEFLQRIRRIKGEALSEAYRIEGILSRLEMQLFLVATGKASLRYAEAAEADLVASTTDEDARRIVRSLVATDVSQAQGSGV
jgi:hypothetical protein